LDQPGAVPNALGVADQPDAGHSVPSGTSSRAAQSPVRLRTWRTVWPAAVASLRRR
jgi:hypothetical protein